MGWANLDTSLKGLRTSNNQVRLMACQPLQSSGGNDRSGLTRDEVKGILSDANQLEKDLMKKSLKHLTKPVPPSKFPTLDFLVGNHQDLKAMDFFQGKRAATQIEATRGSSCSSAGRRNGRE